MHAEDVVALMIPVTFLAMMAIEAALRNGRQWPDIPWWHAKGLAFFLMLMTINAALPSLAPPEFAQHHVFQGASLGVVGGALVGYPCVALVTALHPDGHGQASFTGRATGSPPARSAGRTSFTISRYSSAISRSWSASFCTCTFRKL